MGVVQDVLNAQNVFGRMQPGTPGYWQVWGARVYDIEPGDLVMTKNKEGKYLEYEVGACVRRGDRWDIVQPGFRTPQGEQFALGALMSIVLLRRGAHHTLAGSVR